MIHPHRSAPLFTSLALATLITGCGGGGGSSSAVAPTPAAAPANQAPTADAQSVTALATTDTTGELTGSDPEGNNLTFSLHDAPATGTVTVSGNGLFTYSVSADTTEASTSFTFVASDGSLTSAPATVSITINRRPVATGASATTSDASTATGQVSATDPDGDSVTFVVREPSPLGVLVFGDNGSFTFTPNDTSVDGTATIGVAAHDGAQDSAWVDVVVDIVGWSGPQQIGSDASDFASTGGLTFGLRDGEAEQLLIGGGTNGDLEGTNQGGTDLWVRHVTLRGDTVQPSYQLGTTEDESVRRLITDPVDEGYFVVEGSGSGKVRRFDRSNIEAFAVTPSFEAGDIPNYWANVDAAGDLYTITWVQRGAPFSGTNDLVSEVKKHDGRTGGLLWTRILHSNISSPSDFLIADAANTRARGIDFNSNGDVVVVGGYSNTGSRDCSQCGFAAVLDADTGAVSQFVDQLPFVDQCALPTTDTSAWPYRLTVTENDNLLVAGIQFGTSSGTGDNRAMVALFDPTGTVLQWQQCLDGDNGTVYTDPVLDGDSLLVLAAASEQIDDPALQQDVVAVHRLDLDGNLLASRRMADSMADGSLADVLAGGLLVGPFGNVFVSLSTEGETLGGSSNAGDQDAVLLRLDADLQDAP